MFSAFLSCCLLDIAWSAASAVCLSTGGAVSGCVAGEEHNVYLWGMGSTGQLGKGQQPTCWYSPWIWWLTHVALMPYGLAMSHKACK